METILQSKVLFSAVKNEGPALLEWVAYHRLIGFDRIYVASNDCTDGTDQLLDALDDAGVIAGHIRHQPDPRFGPQKSAISAFKKANLLRDGDWFAFLDADEYLNVHLGGGCLDDLIEKIGTRKGMIIPWRLFGDGDTRGIITRQIDTPFVTAEELGGLQKHHVKSFYQIEQDVLEFEFGNTHRPKIVAGGDMTLDDLLLAGHVSWDHKSRINQRWLAGNVPWGATFVAPSEFSTEFAQINHYSVRNREMYELKKKRGRGFHGKIAPGEAPPTRHDDTFFETNNRNEAVDRSILRHKTNLDKAIKDILISPKIRRCQARIMAFTTKELGKNLVDDAFDESLASPAPIRLNAQSEEHFLPKITLPRSEANFFTEHYQSAKVILEYGSGGSTVFAAGLAPTPVLFSVETDRRWSEKLGTSIKLAYPDAQIHMRYVDIGETKAWGRPKRHNRYLHYPDYAFGIYDDPDFIEPDLIFIDGRFRQACFYAAMFMMSKPVTIIFDDYVKRPRYHGIENYFKPVEIVGRMAKFEVEPMAVPQNDLLKIIKGIMDSE